MVIIISLNDMSVHKMMELLANILHVSKLRKSIIRLAH